MKLRLFTGLLLLLFAIGLYRWSRPAPTPRPVSTAPVAVPSSPPSRPSPNPPEEAPPNAAPADALPPPAPVESPAQQARALPPPIPSAPPQAMAPTRDPAGVPAAPLPELAAPLPTTSLPDDPRVDLDELDLVIRDFRTTVGENPVGTNSEITRSLLGDNRKQVVFSVPGGSSVNGNGEMVDRWGTPYFFHQLSAAAMEVRSAGPDQKMWTADDKVRGRSTAAEE